MVNMYLERKVTLPSFAVLSRSSHTLYLSIGEAVVLPPTTPAMPLEFGYLKWPIKRFNLDILVDARDGSPAQPRNIKHGLVSSVQLSSRVPQCAWLQIILLENVQKWIYPFFYLRRDVLSPLWHFNLGQLSNRCRIPSPVPVAPISRPCRTIDCFGVFVKLITLS